MTLCSQQNSLCFIPVFQSSNMRIKVLSESLHTTARKTIFSLTTTFTLIFSQTWVGGCQETIEGLSFSSHALRLELYTLFTYWAKDSGSVSSPLCSNFSVIKVKVVLLASFFFILESLHGYRIVLTQSSIGCEAYQRGLLTSQYFSKH